MMHDRELLARYAADGDREALGQIVRRHIGFVYAAARRQVRDAHLAEDVTQAVFILLARKARTIRCEAALTSWLFTVTRYAAASARRMQSRRAYHERKAAEVGAMVRKSSNESKAGEDEMLSVLDDAIAHLSESDRRGVLLSFFQNQTFREVGAALGVSEEAARKRVSRALERMRTFFAQRGATVSTASIASVMAAQAAAAAPAHLAAPAANVAIITQSFASNAIVEGVGQMMFWSTLAKPLAAAAAVVVVVCGAVVGQVALQQNSHQAPAAQLAAHAQPAGESVDLGDGVRVEFVGISTIDGSDWHTPAGAVVPPQRIKELLAHLSGTQIVMPDPTHRALVRIVAPAEADVKLTVPKAPAVGAVDAPTRLENERVFITHFRAPSNSGAIDLEVSAATGEWQTLVTDETLTDYTTTGSSMGGIVFSEMIESEGKPAIYVATEIQTAPWRVVAFDNEGMILGTHAGNETSSGRLSTCRAIFDVDRERIHHIEVQSRPYNKRVSCRNCTLDPQHPTRPAIETKK